MVVFLSVYLQLSKLVHILPLSSEGDVFIDLYPSTSLWLQCPLRSSYSPVLLGTSVSSFPPPFPASSLFRPLYGSFYGTQIYGTNTFLERFCAVGTFILRQYVLSFARNSDWAQFTITVQSLLPLSPLLYYDKQPCLYVL